MSKARDIADINSGVDIDGDVSLGDNDKAIFGAGSDLQIYHDGSNSNIKDAGTGPLKIFATDLYVNNSAGNKTLLSGIDGDAVTLYHNGVAKLATTSTGVDVTGTVNATAFTGDGSGLTGVGDITNVSAGGGLTGGGASGDVTVSHADTSSQGSVNNSGNTVIQDITLDTYGHITGMSSATISTTPPTTYGAVGTYAMLKRTATNVTAVPDSTISGGSLRPSGHIVRATTNGVNHKHANYGTMSGTWRCVGYASSLDANWTPVTVYVRIS